MKKLLLTLALAAVTTFTYAQGTIQFANNAGTRFNVNGVRPLNAALGGPALGTYTFGAFVGTSADSLSADPVGGTGLGQNTATGGLIGSANGNIHALNGFLPDAVVFIQIRGWESRFGSDWRAAQQGGLFGQTDVRQVILGPGAGPGTVIWSSTDLTKFQAINLVPEPSSIALAVLGLGSLLLFRRRK